MLQSRLLPRSQAVCHIWSGFFQGGAGCYQSAWPNWRDRKVWDPLHSSVLSSRNRPGTSWDWLSWVWWGYFWHYSGTLNFINKLLFRLFHIYCWFHPIVLVLNPMCKCSLCTLTGIFQSLDWRKFSLLIESPTTTATSPPTTKQFNVIRPCFWIKHYLAFFYCFFI